MLDSVLQAVITALGVQGANAVRDYPESGAGLDGKAVIAVGAESCTCESAGLGDYLGLRKGVGGRADTELFGRRLELCLSLEMFAPPDAGGAKNCGELSQIIRGIRPILPEGLCFRKLQAGEVKFDRELSCFRCKALLFCTAYMVAESTEEDKEFLDFKLKGTVLHGN